jgi:hypothetical protein
MEGYFSLQTIAFHDKPSANIADKGTVARE